MLLLDVTREWFGLVTAPPQAWLWTLAVPGLARRLARRLKRYRGTPYLGRLISAFVDSRALIFLERAGWQILIVLVVGAAIAAPILMLSREREERIAERKTLRAQAPSEYPQV